MTFPGDRIPLRSALLPAALAAGLAVILLCLWMSDAPYRALWTLGTMPWVYGSGELALAMAVLLLPWRRSVAPGAGIALLGLAPFLVGTVTAGLVAWSAGLTAALAGAVIVLHQRSVLARPRWLLRGLGRHLIRYRWPWVGVAGLLIVLGFGWQRFRPMPSAPGASHEARAYLNDAVVLARRFSLWRDTVSWEPVTDSAFVLLAGARHTADAYPALRHVLKALGDHHSVLLSPEDQKASLATSPAPPDLQEARQATEPMGRMTGDHVGYLMVPWFADFVADRAFWSGRLRTLVDSLDREVPCGWILDLRPNLGGNMWPMLDGIAPLLPAGPAGGIDMPQWKRRTGWWIVRGRASPLGPSYLALPLLGGRSHSLKTGTAPVAVLIGPLTVSAGEAVAITFRGRPRTRFFGEPTGGLSTANTAVRLRDGAMMALTIGVDVDRKGRIYGGPIVPDELIPGRSADDSAAVMRAASAWIGRAGACGANPRPRPTPGLPDSRSGVIRGSVESTPRSLR